MDRHQYIIDGRETVPGWFYQADAMLFDAIDVAQERVGITGDILEIGCYQGTSAILLGYLRKPEERFVVCDLFDGPTVNAENAQERDRFYMDLSRHSFETNYLRFHELLPDIVAGPSSTLFECGLARTFRLIHIDGSHQYEAVRSDLLLAKELLLPGGIVVFDDIVTMHTPGVTAAVWEGVMNDGLIPLFQSRKFYGTWGSRIDMRLPEELPRFSHEVLGHMMFNIEDAPPPAPVAAPPADSALRTTDDLAHGLDLSNREQSLIRFKRNFLFAVRTGREALRRRYRDRAKTE